MTEFDGLADSSELSGQGRGGGTPSCDDWTIDKLVEEPYIRTMSTFRHMLLIAVLTTYVVGLGVFAATSGAMAGNMVMGEAGEMGDCEGCDPGTGDDPASACDMPCLTPLMATLAPDSALRLPLSEHTFGITGSSFASRAGPPDSSPPRSTLLS